MWLHESESNSLIRQACKNKIFLTIIYISYNSLLSFHNSRPWLEVTVSTLDTLLLITPSHLLAPGRELRIVSIHRVDVSSLSTKVLFQISDNTHNARRAQEWNSGECVCSKKGHEGTTQNTHK